MNDTPNQNDSKLNSSPKATSRFGRELFRLSLALAISIIVSACFDSYTRYLLIPGMNDPDAAASRGPSQAEAPPAPAADDETSGARARREKRFEEERERVKAEAESERQMQSLCGILRLTLFVYLAELLFVSGYMKFVEYTKSRHGVVRNVMPADASASGNPHYENMAWRLRLRAGMSLFAAWMSMLLVLVAMASGLLLFYFAGSIVTRERGYLLREAIYELDRMRESPRFTDTDIKQSLDSIKTLLNDSDEKSRQEGRLELLIATLATRVGSIALLVFLVQILVSMYRYNARLAAFYSARADALQLVYGNDAKTLNAIVEALAPDDVEFGKAPKSPVSNAVDMVSKIIAAQKEK